MTVPWAELLALLGPLAARAAAWLFSQGCEVTGCPDHVRRPKPADIPPADEEFREALREAEIRARVDMTRALNARPMPVAHLLNRGGARCGAEDGLLTASLATIPAGVTMCPACALAAATGA